MNITLKNFASVATIALFALVFVFGAFSIANAATYGGSGSGGGCCTGGGGGGGGGGSYTPPTYKAPSCTLSASANSIMSGQSATLTWSSNRATSAYLSTVGSVATNGSQTVSPTYTQTYVLTVYGEGGSRTCTKTIVVTTPPVQPACTLNASPAAITNGQSATLSWSSSNATSATLSSVGSVATNGSQAVSPTYTQNYVLTVYGENGVATCTKTITVTAPVVDAPTCNIYVAQPSYNQNYNQYNQYGNYNHPVSPIQGGPVTISWNSQYAYSGWINQGVGAVSLSGSRTVYPSQTTVYIATFVGQNGQQVTCSATVNINTYVPPPVYPPIYQNPAPYITLSAVPYTGLDLGPVGTVLYWGFLVAWSLFAAYLIAIKRAHMSLYRWYSKALFGSTELTTSGSEAASTPALATNAGALSRSELASIVAQLEALVAGKKVSTTPSAPLIGSESGAIDPFVLSQINRPRN